MAVRRDMMAENDQDNPLASMVKLILCMKPYTPPVVTPESMNKYIEEKARKSEPPKASPADTASSLPRNGKFRWLPKFGNGTKEGLAPKSIKKL